MPNDYLLDANDDLQIANGDFVVGESTSQHKSLLLRGKKGELRQYPKTNVGLDDFLQDDDPGDVYQEIQKQFEGDGLKVRSIQISVSDQEMLQANVDAYYP
jgi:hypothetical protein